MNFEEIKKFLDENKDSEEVKGFIGGLVTTDRVMDFITNTEDGKKLMQKEKDSHFTKSLETWKTNNLNKLVEDEIVKKFPAETEAEKKIRQLQADFESEKKGRLKSDLKGKAIKALTEKGIPLDFADHFIGEDDETTTANLAKLESIWTPALTKAVEAKFAAGGRDPQASAVISTEFKEGMEMSDYAAMREKQGIK